MSDEYLVSYIDRIKGKDIVFLATYKNEEIVYVEWAYPVELKKSWYNNTIWNRYAGPSEDWEEYYDKETASYFNKPLPTTMKERFEEAKTKFRIGCKLEKI